MAGSCASFQIWVAFLLFQSDLEGDFPHLPFLPPRERSKERMFTLCLCLWIGETSPISLSFLLEKEVKNECSLYVYVYGSAAGLFLVQISPSYEYVVANPLTRTFLELPLLSSIPKISNMGIVGGESNIQDTYKVVAVGMSSDLNAGYIVEIYNSIDKSWRIAGHLPKDVKPVEMPVVFCAGAFYCNGFIHGERVIVVFDIKEGTSIFVPLPNIVDNYRMVPYLLACGSRVLVAGHDAEPLQFIIWEFDKVKVNSSSTSTSSSSSSWWKEIARMPQSDLERFSLLNGTISWAGVGDCACFILAEHKMTEVVVYNVTENTWSWLPSLPLDTERSWQGYQLSVAFEPRPDMKVG
uniref:F-box associated beta-propeller type 1 domain-containing protein n=1 Tax=Picea sitchensis TaxID=3332 RepID=D5A9Y1_PICSI|nr:unknown [Picea sitchensis]